MCDSAGAKCQVWDSELPWQAMLWKHYVHDLLQSWLISSSLCQPMLLF